MVKATVALLVVLSVSGAAFANIAITEWAYSATDGEFVEFTNIGTTAIDMTGWSFDDDSEIAGTLDLSAFGVVQPGESVVITENVEATFRAAWALPASVKVIGEYTNNLGRNDEINLYNAASLLVDRLTYGDDSFAGSIRTQGASGNPLSPAVLVTNDVYGWTLSTIGDSYGSYASTSGDIGNPGTYAVPEPAAVLLFGLAGMLIRRR